jgi:hypothetical protein
MYMGRETFNPKLIMVPGPFMMRMHSSCCGWLLYPRIPLCCQASHVLCSLLSYLKPHLIVMYTTHARTHKERERGRKGGREGGERERWGKEDLSRPTTFPKP